MTRFRAVLPAVACTLLMLVGACARDAGTDTDTGAAAPDEATSAPAEALVLRVAHLGGFLDAASIAARLPVISVYGDGRVVTQGPQVLIYPGPAVPNVQVQQIPANDVDKLVATARAAGVGTATDLGKPTITDVPTTRFTVRVDAAAKTTDVYALAEADEGAQGLTEQQRADRAKLRGLVDALTDLPKTIGAPAETQPYQPVAVAAVVSPWASDAQAPPDQAELAWPGPALPGAAITGGTGVTCVNVTGDAVAKVMDAAGQASAATPWSSGGKRWSVMLRPLLPDESGCTDLSTAAG